MKLREFLNEYELDWAQAPARNSRLSFEMFKNKNVAVVGNSESTFVRSIVISLLSLNDTFGELNIKVTFIPYSFDDNKLYADLLKHRNDLNIARSISELNPDYMIMTGCACQELPFDWDEDMQLFIKLFSEISVCRPARLLLLSDYRVYGSPIYPYIFSEHEMLPFDFDDVMSQEQIFLQSLETLAAACGHQQNIPYNILRFSMSYGAEVTCNNNLLYQVADALCNTDSSVRIDDFNSFNCIYLNDILSAIYFVLEKCPYNKVFNASGPDVSLSTKKILCLCEELFPNRKQKKIKPEAGSAAALNNNLLMHYGWQPRINIEDGMTLLIKSRSNNDGIFIFDNSYQGKLDTIHNILLGYLLEIDRICRKHDIKYFLAGGTLLGAVRHHGFIPWDDDADVMMLREDYDKFCDIVQNELPDNLFYQVPNTEKVNHHVFSKIRINNTLFATKFTGKFLNMHNGIFIDILAHDNTGNHKLSQKLHIYMTLLTRSLVFNKWGGANIRSGGRHPFLCACANIVKKILPMKMLETFQYQTIKLYKHSRRSEYLYDGMGRNLRRGAFPKEWLSEAVLVDFEGYKLPIPKEYDKYLTYLYGDYNQMLPVSERRTSHDIVLMDLGEYSNYKIKKCGNYADIL